MLKNFHQTKFSCYNIVLTRIELGLHETSCLVLTFPSSIFLSWRVSCPIGLSYVNSYLYSKLKIKTNSIHKKTHELSNLPLKIPNHFFTFLTSLLSGLKQNFTISPLFVDYLHSFAIFNYPAFIFLKCVMITANNSIIRLH